MKDVLVEARGLGMTFPGGVAALVGIDLEVAEGELVSIVGPSGCGKSTLLRLVAGLLEPTSGRLSVGAGRRRGFVFQDANLLPWRTVAGNVGLSLELEGVARSERKRLVAEGLERVGLTEFAGALPRQLSGGMRMRVSLARALATAPELLLFDEPFGALDDLTRTRLNEELLRLWRASRWTGLFVTHNVGEAVFLGQRVLVLSARPGRLAASFEVPFAHPRSPDLRAEPAFARLVGRVAAGLREVGS